MFPLRFPYRILRSRASESDRVLDPFCGRGTTNYAARLLGLDSVGIDSSLVAAAVAQAKVVRATPASIERALRSALDSVSRPTDLPEGEFWDLAFHRQTLRALCRVREALLKDCRSESRMALRAIILGALHGPRSKSAPSYLSNQSPRTFAPKPDYAVRFWKARDLYPVEVDLHSVMRPRAKRFYGLGTEDTTGLIVHGDSRQQETFQAVRGPRFKWVITSPPYYGMRTYIPDQWLRNWFLGGSSTTDYSNTGQLAHGGADRFARDLRIVWRGIAGRCSPGAQLVIRFGGINDRDADPMSVIKESLESSGWTVTTIVPAGLASAGKRQAVHFGPIVETPRAEFDVWARRDEALSRLHGHG